MERLLKLLLIGILVFIGKVYAQDSTESILNEYRKQFTKDYFSIGTLMQFVFDYQNERSLPGNNGFNVANMRLQLKGKFDEGFGYFFQMKFDSSPAILDAYMMYQISTPIVLQVGQFKSPFSKEFLIPASDIDFVNRSRVVSALAPGRQIGFQVNGFLLNNIVNYNISVSNGNNIAQNSNDNDNFLYTGRIAFFPKLFKDIKNGGLEFGLNTAFSEDSSANIIGGLIPVFSGNRLLIGGDVRFNYYSLLLAGEYIRAKLEPNSGGGIIPQGFQVTAGYKILSKCQVLVRLDQFDLDNLTAKNVNSDWLIFGINYWPTSITELQLNYTVDLDESDIKQHQVLVNTQISF